MNEIRAITKIPNARTNIEALTKMSILMRILEERGIVDKNRNSHQTLVDSSPNLRLAGLGVVLIVGGIALSSSSGHFFMVLFW